MGAEHLHGGENKQPNTQALCCLSCVSVRMEWQLQACGAAMFADASLLLNWLQAACCTTLHQMPASLPMRLAAPTGVAGACASYRLLMSAGLPTSSSQLHVHAAHAPPPSPTWYAGTLTTAPSPA